MVTQADFGLRERRFIAGGLVSGAATRADRAQGAAADPGRAAAARWRRAERESNAAGRTSEENRFSGK